MIQKLRKPLVMTVATELKKTVSQMGRNPRKMRRKEKTELKKRGSQMGKMPWKMRRKERKSILKVRSYAINCLLVLGSYLERLSLPKGKVYILEEARKKIEWRPKKYSQEELE